MSRNHPQKNDERKNKREVKEEKENEFQSNVYMLPQTEHIAAKNYTECCRVWQRRIRWLEL